MAALPILLLAATAAAFVLGAVRDNRPGDRLVYAICAAFFGFGAGILLVGGA